MTELSSLDASGVFVTSLRFKTKTDQVALKVVPKEVHGGLLARSGFPPPRSLAAVRLRVTYAGRSRHCFLTNEWPLLYHGQRCELRENEKGRCLAKYLRLKFAGCTPFLPA